MIKQAGVRGFMLMAQLFWQTIAIVADCSYK